MGRDVKSGGIIRIRHGGRFVGSHTIPVALGFPAHAGSVVAANDLAEAGSPAHAATTHAPLRPWSRCCSSLACSSRRL